MIGVGSTMLSQEVVFEAGSEVDVHAHPHEQITYVVRGALAFRVGEKHVELREGECLVIPGNAPHGCRALEPTVAFDVFHPVREDYLAEMGRGAAERA